MAHDTPRLADTLDRLTAVVTTLGAAVGLLAMIALFIVGVVEIGFGVAEFVLIWFHSGSGESDHPGAVKTLIQGVEVLLLAPVAYLVFLALGQYLRRPKDEDHARRAHAELLGVKAFVTGLLFALAATNVVGQALEQKLRYEGAVASSLVLLVLGAYFYILEKFASVGRH